MMLGHFHRDLMSPRLAKMKRWTPLADIQVRILFEEEYVYSFKTILNNV